MLGLSQLKANIKDPSRVLFIIGPTASGKTGISLQIAKQIDSLIISADSRQVYLDMDICTAKHAARPAQAALSESLPLAQQPYMIEGIAHYLIDIVAPSARYSLFDFQKDAKQIIASAFAEGIKPIVCGGTGLYVDSLIKNYQVNAQTSESLELKNQLNQEYQDLLKSKPSEAKDLMWQKLQAISPKRAAEIHPHNIHAILRELEFMLLNKESKTAVAKTSSPEFAYDIILIWPERQELYSRINARIDSQLSQGLEQETAKLYAKYPNAHTALSSLGYKQVKAYLDNPEIKQQQIDEFKKLTRNYAKRQYTWFTRYLELENLFKIQDPQDLKI